MRSLTGLVLVLSLLAACTQQQDSSTSTDHDQLEHAQASGDHHTGAHGVEFPVSCDESVQDDFNTAVASIHNMTYRVARDQFGAILDADPECGMAHWGIGMTYIHPLWSDSPSPDEVADGLAQVEAARSTDLSDREAAWVDALSVYYENADVELYERLKMYAAAVDELYREYPDDLEAKAFYAVTHLSTMEPGTVDMEIITEASTAAFQVLEQAPDHPGGHHYVIHSFDYPGLAERAVEVARSYAELAPDNPHSLHMPSHIFTRLGMWDASIELNARSAAVAKHQPWGDAVSLHYPHALDYMLYGYLQTGQDSRARAVVDSVLAIKPPIQPHPAAAYHLASAEVRWDLERHDWAAAADIEPRSPEGFPWDDFPAFEALSHFAIALGAAHSGDHNKATQAILRLGKLEEQTEQPYWKKQVEVMRLASRAWLHEVTGRPDKAEELMNQSADLEAEMSKHPITPGEVLPSAELLGDMLLLHGKPAEALDAYRASLERTPNRFNSLFGAGQAADAMGDTESARQYFQKLVEICDDADTDRSELEFAKGFVVG